jgi:hypothetical protein
MKPLNRVVVLALGNAFHFNDAVAREKKSKRNRRWLVVHRHRQVIARFDRDQVNAWWTEEAE